MPIFEFRCKACGHVYDELGKWDDATSCPECQSDDTKKLVSAPHIPVAPLARGDSATPDSIDRWAKMRKQKMAIEQQKKADHGTYE